MIALLKAHWILALVAAVGAWLMLRRRVVTVALNPNGVPMSVATKLAASGAADNGALGDPNLWKLADQAIYPGYYTTKYGGFYNPDTGESYSPGSSPAVYTTAAQRGVEQAYIDLAAVDPNAGVDTRVGGADYNPVTANAVIY